MLDSDAEAVKAIRETCDLYKALISTHVRGEYLQYQIAADDAPGFEWIRESEGIENNGEEWYKKQTDALLYVWGIINRILGFSENVNAGTGLVSNADGRQLERIEVYDESGTLEDTFVLNYTGELLTQIDNSYDLNSDDGWTTYTVLQYDSEQNLISNITYSDDHSAGNAGVEYEYNSDGQMIRSRQWEGGAVESEYEYDLSGKLVLKIENTGFSQTATEYIYDDDGRKSIEIRETITVDGLNWVDFADYTYDQDGRLLREHCINNVNEDMNKPQTHMYMTYVYAYKPFVYSEYTIKDEGFWGSWLNLQDETGLQLFSLYLPEEAELLTDSEGYLTKIVSDDSTYILSYTEVGRGATDIVVKDAYAAVHDMDWFELQQYIPEIYVNGTYLENVNTTIYEELEEYIGEDSWASVTYSYSEVVDECLSIVVQIEFPDMSYQFYSIYSVDVMNDVFISPDDILALYDMDEETYYARIRAGIVNYYQQWEDSWAGDSTVISQAQECKNDSLSMSNVEAAIPFIDENGDLCANVRMYWMAGADYYEHLINLQTGQSL